MKIFKGKYFYLSLLLAIFVLPILSAKASTFNPKNQSFDFGSKIVKAADTGNIDILKSLLEQGGNPNEKGKFEAAALHRSAINNNLPITKLLISKGANVDIVDFGGASPLHVTAREGNLEVLKHLLKNNADIDLKDKEGFTPLHRAVVSNKSAAAITLIEAGAEVNTESRTKNSPIIDAARKGNYKIVEELIAKGANKQKTNNKGYTAYDYAQKINNTKVLESLEKTKSQILRSRAVDKSPVIVVDSKAAETEIPAFLATKVEQEKKDIYAPAKEIDSLATVSLGRKIENDDITFNDQASNGVKTAVQDVLTAELPDISNSNNEEGLLIAASKTPKIEVTKKAQSKAQQASVKVVPLNSDVLAEMEFTSNDPLLEELGRPKQTSSITIKPISDIKTSLAANKFNKAGSYSKPTAMDSGYNYQEFKFKTPPKSILPASNKISLIKNKNLLMGDGFTPMSLIFKDSRGKEYNNIIRSNIQKPKERTAINFENKNVSYNKVQTNIESDNLDKNASIPKSLQIKEALELTNKNLENNKKQTGPRYVNSAYTKQNIVPNSNVAFTKTQNKTEIAPTQVNYTKKQTKISKPKITVRKLDVPIILNQQAEKKIVNYQLPKLQEPKKQRLEMKNQGVLGNMAEFFGDTTYDYSSKYDMQELESQRVENLGLAQPLSLSIKQKQTTQTQPNFVNKAYPTTPINSSADNIPKNNYVRINPKYSYKENARIIDIQNSPIDGPKTLANKTTNIKVNEPLPEIDVTVLEPSLALFDTLEMQKGNIEDNDVIVSGFNQSNIIKKAKRRPVASNYNYLDPSKPQVYVRPIIEQQNNLQAHAINKVSSPEDTKTISQNIPLSLRMKSSVQGKNYQRMFNNMVAKEKLQNESNIKPQKIASSFTLPRNENDNLPGDIINSAPLPDVEIASMQTLKTPEIEEDMILDELPPLSDNLPDLEKEFENAEPNLNEIQENLEDSVIGEQQPKQKTAKDNIVKFDIRDDNSLQGFHAEVNSFETSKEAEQYYNEIASRFGVVHAYKIARDNSGKYKVAIGKMPSQQEAQKLCVIFKSDKTDCVVSNYPKGEIYSNKKVYSILGEFSSSVAASSYIKSRTDVNLGKTGYNIARAGNTSVYLLQIGPVSSGEEAKNICENLRKENQRCKIAVQ